MPNPMATIALPPQMQWHMLQQAMAACNPMGACGCGVPMGMMAGGLPMQGFPMMQPMSYDGMDSNVLMAGMMPFGGMDANQYAAMSMFGQNYPYGGGGFDYQEGLRPDMNQEDDEDDGDDDEADPAMAAPSYVSPAAHLA
ncbi:unnamed protein product [Effrenium voratum]|nr:unnamed protein product [Effrenium voratum]CAJ1454899.1 unnamed protein product [Effrenium voratum]